MTYDGMWYGVSTYPAVTHSQTIRLMLTYDAMTYHTIPLCLLRSDILTYSAGKAPHIQYNYATCLNVVLRQNVLYKNISLALGLRNASEIGKHKHCSKRSFADIQKAHRTFYSKRKHPNSPQENHKTCKEMLLS